LWSQDWNVGELIFGAFAIRLQNPGKFGDRYFTSFPVGLTGSFNHEEDFASSGAIAHILQSDRQFPASWPLWGIFVLTSFVHPEWLTNIFADLFSTSGLRYAVCLQLNYPTIMTARNGATSREVASNS